MREFLQRVLTDQDQFLKELIVQCLQLDPDHRPTCDIMISFLTENAEFKLAREDLAQLAREKPINEGYEIKQLIFPKHVMQIFDKTLYSVPKTPLQWLENIESKPVDQRTPFAFSKYFGADDIPGFIRSVREFSENEK